MSIPQRNPPQLAARQSRQMPQDHTCKRNTLETSENFITSATNHNSPNMALNCSTPAPMRYQPIQPGLPGTDNRVTSQFQQITSNDVPSPTHHEPAAQQKLRSQMRKCLGEKIPGSGFQYKPYVFSEEDFRMKMTAYLALNDRITPVDTIDDFPTNPEVQRRLAQDLVEAMLNTDKNTLIDPEAKLPLARIGKLSPFEIDLMAWNILFETRDIHRGKISLPSWGKDWPWQEFSSFSERFKAVKKALYHCKAMVASVFDEVFVKRLPLNPSAETSRKSSNKRLNGKRKRDLDFAKSAKQDGFVPSNLRPTTPGSIPPTDCQSSSPRRLLFTQQEPSTEPEHKQICGDQKSGKIDYDFFALEQKAASLLDTYERPQLHQGSKAGGLQFASNDEYESGTNESDLTGSTFSAADTTFGSPFTFSMEQGSPRHLSRSSTTHHTLQANKLNQWPDATSVMGSNLDPGLFNNDPFEPSSEQQWTGHTDSFKATAPGNMALFRGRQKSSANVTARLPTGALMSATNDQQGTMPALSSSSSKPAMPQTMPQNLYHTDHQCSLLGEASKTQGTIADAELWYQNSVPTTGTPMEDAQGQASQDPLRLRDCTGAKQGNGSQHIWEQTQAMLEDSLQPNNTIDDPITNEELEGLLGMPDDFDLDLGMWNNENGDPTQFTGF